MNCIVQPQHQPVTQGNLAIALMNIEEMDIMLKKMEKKPRVNLKVYDTKQLGE